MNSAIICIIDKAKETVVSGGLIDKDVITALLEIEPDSDECEYLGKTAREVAKILTNDMARIGTSIGLDLCPCSASCEFCSLGEKWGLVRECAEIDDETVIEIIRKKREEGYFQFTLRTTEYYNLDRLCELGRRIRKEVPGTIISQPILASLPPRKQGICSIPDSLAYIMYRVSAKEDTPRSVWRNASRR